MPDSMQAQKRRMVTLAGGPCDGMEIEVPEDAIVGGAFKVVEPITPFVGMVEDETQVPISPTMALTAYTYRLYGPDSSLAGWIPEPSHLAAEREAEADEFVQHVYALVEYWKKQDDPVHGVAFSILVMLDGGAAVGPYELRPVPEDTAITWRRGPDIAGELHERFSALGREENRASSAWQPGSDTT